MHIHEGRWVALQKKAPCLKGVYTVAALDDLLHVLYNLNPFIPAAMSLGQNRLRLGKQRCTGVLTLEEAATPQHCH